MIAQQPQGGLSQVSQPLQAKPFILPQAKPAQKPDQSADADRIAAEQVTSQEEPFDLNKELTDLSKGRMVLDAQIQKMQQALTKRTLNYDPALLALGIGLAQPTKTGNFVEALGQGAGAYHKGNVDEMARQQDLMEKQYALAKDQYSLRQKIASSAYNQTLLGSQVGMPSQAPAMGAPSGGGAPLGGLAVPAGGAPAGAPPMGGGMPQSRLGLPTTVTGFPPLNRQQLFASQDIGDEANTRFLERIQRSEIEAKKASDAGFTEVLIPETDKKVRIRVEVADAFHALGREVAETGDEQKLIKFMVANKMIPAIGRKTNAQGQVEYEKPKTALEEAQEKERLTQTEKTRAESSEKSATDLKNRALIAFDNIQTGNDMISYVKNQPEIFRFMNTGGLRDTIMNAVKNGIAGTIGGADLRVNLPLDTLKRLYKDKTGQNITDQQIDTLQMFAQSAAQLNIQFRRTMQGQGQITEKESELAKQLGAMLDDSDVVIRLKSELMIERSKFDDKSYGHWLEYRKTGKSYDEYLHSAEYKALKADYSDTLKNIREANVDLLKKKPTSTSAPATSANPNARPPSTSLPSTNSSVPPGYIADPQTGVIRKKREGE